MSSLAISVRAGGDDRAAVVRALVAAGSRAVEEVGDELRTYLPAGTSIEPIVAAVTAVSPLARVETSNVAVTDWDAAWRERLSVRHAGPLVIAPPWLAGGLDPRFTIVVEPGMAFGTGDHPTTRGVLRLAAEVIRAGDRVADIGAGSAVLSIGAAKLGAASVAAVEVDPDAIENAETNVRLNDVNDRVTVLLGDATVLLPLIAPVRVVLANIVPPVLVSLLPTIDQAVTPDGRAIVGGITQEEQPDFVDATDKAGWRVQTEDIEESWWSAVLTRR